MTGPLDGFRVVELGVWVAGPAAAGLLADWGADVIKVEPPAGDPQRRVFGAIGIGTQAAVPPFEVDNRGKRSVVLDLQEAEGRAQMERLLATADAFITNVRPGALRRLGLHHDDVLGRHPRLVYGSLTGYGLEGPDRDRAGYDVGAFWARSGLAHSIVPPASCRPALRSGMGDHVTGLTMAAGVVAKLLAQGAHRRGRAGGDEPAARRDVHARLGHRHPLRLGQAASRRRTREQGRTPLLNCYRAARRPGVLAALLEADRHWPKLVAALGREDLATDERFADARARRANAAELTAALDVAFAAGAVRGDRPRRSTSTTCGGRRSTPIVDVIEDPQAQRRRRLRRHDPRDGEAPYRAVQQPVGLRRRAHPPRPGADARRAHRRGPRLAALSSDRHDPPSVVSRAGGRCDRRGATGQRVSRAGRAAAVDVVALGGLTRRPPDRHRRPRARRTGRTCSA